MKKLLTWKTGIVVLVCMVLVACMLCVNSSLAWYTLVPGAEHAIIVDADGTDYLLAPSDWDEYNGSEARTMKPAVALPFAVANGAPINVLQTYEETKDTDHPSYVQTKATYGYYSGRFEKSLEPGKGVYYDFALSAYLDRFTKEQLLNGEVDDIKLGKEEFVYDEISFKYYYSRVTQLIHEQDDQGNEVIRPVEELVEMDPLSYDENCGINEDGSSGTIFLCGDVRLIVYVNIKMHIANVDELMDSRIGQQNVIRFGLGLHADETVAWQDEAPIDIWIN